METRVEKSLLAMLVSSDGETRREYVPVDDSRKTLEFVQRTVGRSPRFFRGLEKDLDIILNDDVERFFSEPACRAVYATGYHVGKTYDLYDWDDEWVKVEKAGELIGIIHGDFLVIARELDEEGTFVARSMTDEEISYVEEVFADESTGRLEELKRNLGLKD